LDELDGEARLSDAAAADHDELVLAKKLRSESEMFISHVGQSDGGEAGVAETVKP
jgi:hypothetical protein